ncbi:Dolichyl-phosphate-mannose-protein mannosyltransferase [Pedobacter terrae]|uniref:Dolichyl-phosphate-mannose-protein mannosyltransferase n=1 Tax=Pedobacter terrae TaxID=405671 RepID=A0A1G7SGF4_9SPHI|nr:glycosyltransferase family 39 protein [Pedobacter terrae]SDG22002.1 Dolichyl-phosphate-mannose-protein mannosyltransferase [Pedobacter terrae]
MKDKNPNRPAEYGCLVFFLMLKLTLSFVLVNSVYELHRDEFLHLDQANHLAAGFTSVPPLTSLFSWLIKAFGNGVFMVKFVPALIGVLTLLYCWKIVDFLKGNLLAKCLVAVAFLCSSLLRLNTLYQPNSFDVLAWTAVFYYLLKYFNKNEAKYLYSFAIFVALGFLNKYNILFLIIGLLPAIIITSNRKIFADKHLYLSVLLILVIISPNLIWQINHHFPVLTHMKLLQATQLVHVKRIDFLITQFLFFISSIFVLLAGIGSLIFYKDFRKHGWIILTYFITLAVFSYFKAKDYYALGLYPVLLAFGAVYLSRFLAKKYILTGCLFAFNIGSFIYLLPLLMPVYSPDEIIAHHKRFERVGALRWEDGKNHELPQDYADMQGWKELAALVDIAYGKVKDKSTLLIRADNYGQAGAINYYSKYKNINAVSYNADYLYWFKMDKPIKNFIMITESKDEDPLRKREQPYFGKITKIGEIKTPYARERGASVFLLEDAKPEVSNIIKSEIEEEKNDH